MLSQKQTQKLQPRLSMTMWVPLLQTATVDLPGMIRKMADENPLITIKQRKSEPPLFKRVKNQAQGGSAEMIERTIVQKESLYEKLQEQIGPPLFPVEKSQEIAYAIIEYISEEGYFEGNVEEIAEELETEPETVERIRKRFAHLEPVGVGAVDEAESHRFQMGALDVEEEMQELVIALLDFSQKPGELKKHPLHKKAQAVLRHLHNPPALQYQEESVQVIPELYVFQNEENLEVAVNDRYYPEITISKIDTEKLGSKQVQEARNLSKLLDLRKSTLYNIGAFLATRQYDFFYGGNLKPLVMQEAADYFGYNQSTISRAIAQKYLECDRGVYPIKQLFEKGIEDKVTPSEVKSMIQEIVQNEPNQNPISDEQIRTFVNRRYEINLTRRSVANYRNELAIPSASDRKQ